MIALILAIINLHTKFEVCSFTYSKDMMRDPKCKTVSRDWPRPLGGIG